MIESLGVNFVLYGVVTLITYQACAWLQRVTKQVWLNPMLLSLFVIIPMLVMNQISFSEYYRETKIFSYLLEPAIVALGYPLYQQMHAIKAQFKVVMLSLFFSISLMMVINVLIVMFVIGEQSIASSLAFKSVTTPIGLVLTHETGGVAAITSVAIIIAGLTGSIGGVRFLAFCGVHCPKSQGLAIGSASHAIGTATVTPISYEHGAFSSFSLIMSALITAVVSPVLIPFLLTL